MNTSIEQSEYVVKCDSSQLQSMCFIHEGNPNTNTITSNFYREPYPNGEEILWREEGTQATSTSSVVPTFDTWIDLCGNLIELNQVPLKLPVLRRQTVIDRSPYLPELFPVVDFEKLDESNFSNSKDYMTESQSTDYFTQLRNLNEKMSTTSPPKAKELTRYIFDFDESQSVFMDSLDDASDNYLPSESNQLDWFSEPIQPSWPRETNKQDECGSIETNTNSIDVVDWSLYANQYISFLQDPNNIQKPYCPRTDVRPPTDVDVFFADLADCFELEEDAEFEELSVEIQNQINEPNQTVILYEDQPPPLPKRLTRLTGDDNQDNHNLRHLTDGFYDRPFYMQDGVAHHPDESELS